MDHERKTIQSTQISFSIIEALQEKGPTSLTHIANEVDSPSSTVYHHLATLQKLGYVLKKGSEYRLSMKFLSVSESIKRNTSWYPMVKDKIDELAEETEERVQFTVEEQGRATYVYSSRGARAIQVGPTNGELVPLHATSAGKSILASISSDRAQSLINQLQFDKYTDKTITDREMFEEELEKVREVGYASNEEEYFEGIKAVGVPVLTPDGRTIGALSITGPTQRMKGERYQKELPQLLLGTANEVEVNITYS